MKWQILWAIALIVAVLVVCFTVLALRGLVPQEAVIRAVEALILAVGYLAGRIQRQPGWAKALFGGESGGKT